MPRPVAHLANLDLNLLVALRELLRERSVTRAAERLGVTQPAASAALSRLRRHFGDELLVRDRGEYALSALGAQLAGQAYFAGMKSAGYTSENQLDNSQEGWDAGLEINWAVTSAGTLDETTVMRKLQHLNINTLGIVWSRTPADYENITQVLAAMETIAPDGTVTLYNAAK